MERRGPRHIDSTRFGIGRQERNTRPGSRGGGGSISPEISTSELGELLKPYAAPEGEYAVTDGAYYMGPNGPVFIGAMTEDAFRSGAISFLNSVGGAGGGKGRGPCLESAHTRYESPTKSPPNAEQLETLAKFGMGSPETSQPSGPAVGKGRNAPEIEE